MVKVHRPKFSGKKQLNCLRKVRPVNKGLTPSSKFSSAKNDNVVRLTLTPSLPPIPRHMDLPFTASCHLPRLIVMHLDESNGGITQTPIDLDVSVLPIVL